VLKISTSGFFIGLGERRNVHEATETDQMQSVSVEYTPPSRDSLYRFAHKVCEQRGDNTPETVQGLTDFLVICSRIKAKQMSTKG
jgi:hypothetical protein